MGDVFTDNISISQDLLSAAPFLERSHLQRSIPSGNVMGRGGDQVGSDSLKVSSISLGKGGKINQIVPLPTICVSLHTRAQTPCICSSPGSITLSAKADDQPQGNDADRVFHGETNGSRGRVGGSPSKLTSDAGNNPVSTQKIIGNNWKENTENDDEGKEQLKYEAEQAEGKETADGEPKVLRELPGDLLQLCLARVPHRFHPRLKAVCKLWRMLADGHRLLQIRREAEKTEVWTFILENEYDYYRKYLGLRGHAYNLYRLGNTSPPPQAPYGYIMWDGDRPYVAPFEGGHPIARLQTPLRLEYGAAGADSRLYVMGGRPALNGWHTGFSKPPAWEVFSRVDVYNPVDNTWQQVTPMPVARYGFATGALKDPLSNQVKVVVAGGYGTDENPLSSADIYDPASDTWRSIPPMQNSSGACRGQVVDGRFLVKQLDDGLFIEAFDLSTRAWCTLLDNGQVERDPLNIGDMNNNRSRNFTSLLL